MDWQQALFAAAFSLLGSPVTWLEVVAFVLAIWMVMANMRVQIVAWPLAIASSAAYLVLFAHSRLYGEASLQLMFIAVSCWGWWQWKPDSRRAFSRMPRLCPYIARNSG